jgi:hypothetical protein
MLGAIDQWNRDAGRQADLGKCLELVRSIIMPGIRANLMDALKNDTAPLPQLKCLVSTYESLKKGNSDFLDRNMASNALIETFLKDVFDKFRAAFIQHLVDEWNMSSVSKSMFDLGSGDVGEDAKKDLHNMFHNLLAVTPKAIAKPFAAQWPKLFDNAQVKALQAIPEMIHAGIKAVKTVSIFMPTLFLEKSSSEELANQDLMSLINEGNLNAIALLADKTQVFNESGDFKRIWECLATRLEMFISRAASHVVAAFEPVALHGLGQEPEFNCGIVVTWMV